MNPIFLKIGEFELRYYGLMYAIAFLLGMYIAKKLGEKRNIEKGLIEDFAFFAMISGLIGGRLYYVIFTFKDNYLGQAWWKIFAVWEGGMAIHGGIIGGLIGCIVFAKLKKLKILDLTDIAVIPLILGQAIGRIGNFMNGEIHGVPVFTPWRIIFSNGKFYSWWEKYQNLSQTEQLKFKDLVPWGIEFKQGTPAGNEFPGYELHPAMLYEMVLNFAAFWILLYLFQKRSNIKRGYISAFYLIMYSIIRIFVSFFRAEDIMFLGFRLPHVVGIITILATMLMLGILSKMYKKDNEEIE